MSNGVLADQDKPALNDARVASANFVGATMHLAAAISSIDHTITQAVLAANEISTAGYAAQTLTGWSASVLTADFHGESSAAPVTFMNTSGGNTPLITAWWYKDAVTGLCIVAGLFDNPFVILAGGHYTTTPTFRVTNE